MSKQLVYLSSCSLQHTSFGNITEHSTGITGIQRGRIQPLALHGCFTQRGFFLILSKTHSLSQVQALVIATQIPHLSAAPPQTTNLNVISQQWPPQAVHRVNEQVKSQLKMDSLSTKKCTVGEYKKGLQSWTDRPTDPWQPERLLSSLKHTHTYCSSIQEVVLDLHNLIFR